MTIQPRFTLAPEDGGTVPPDAPSISLASAPAPEPPIPLLPATKDLQVYRGDSYGWQIVVWADTAATVPVDLSGAVAQAQVRPGHGGAVEVEFDMTIIPPNTIDMVLPAAKSRLAGNGRWDLQLTFPSGEVRTILVGSFTVIDDITEEVLP